MQSVAILSEYFHNNLGLANGISMAGGTVGPFILSPLLNFGLENLELKGSFIMLTAITMLTIPLCTILKHNRKKSTPPAAVASNHASKLNCCFRNAKSYNLNHQHNLSLKGSLPSLDKFTVSLKRFQTLNEPDTRQQTVDRINETVNALVNERAKSITSFEDQLTNSTTTNPHITNNRNSSLFIIDYNQDYNQDHNQDHNQAYNHQQTMKENFFSLLKRQLSKFKASTKRMNAIKLSKPTLKLQTSLSSTNSMVAFSINNVLSVISSVYFLLIMYTHLGRLRRKFRT